MCWTREWSQVPYRALNGILGLFRMGTANLDEKQSHIPLVPDPTLRS